MRRLQRISFVYAACDALPPQRSIVAPAIGWDQAVAGLVAASSLMRPPTRWIPYLCRQTPQIRVSCVEQVMYPDATVIEGTG